MPDEHNQQINNPARNQGAQGNFHAPVNITHHHGEPPLHFTRPIPPQPPDDFVPRPHEFDQLLAHLCSNDSGPVAITAAGAGDWPLAYALAARRVGTLSPQAMLAYIHDPLALAEGTIRHVPERQQSIAASFDWSYNLLETSEQLLFNRLSVFAGGFTIAAVTEVCTDEHILAIQVLSAIESLIQKSLLRLKDMMSREPRITILEPVREYAFKRLHERGETSTLFHRHAHYYLKLAEEAAPELKGSRQESWLRRLEDEHGNIRAALHRLIEDGEAETALRFCVALELFWYWRGYRQEERLWLKRILASSSLSDAARAKALDEAGGIAWAQGDYDEAKHLSGQSLELWKKLDHTEGMLEALNTLGLVAESQGELEQAIALHEQGLVLRRRLNNPFRVAIALGNLGDAELYHQPAQPERAIERFKESFWLYQSLEDRNGMAGMLVSLGDAALFLGDYIRAIAQFRQSLVLYQQVGNANRNRLARCLERLAAVFLALDDAERSAHLLGAAATLRKEYHLPCPPIYSFHCEQTLNTTRHHLGEAAFQVAYTSGKVMSCEDAIAYALDAPVSPVTLCRWKQPEIAHWQIERPTAAEGPMARAALVSPLAIPLTPCQVVIPSWHATTPPGTWIEVYLRARIEQRWTRYYRMVRWDSALEQSQRCSFDAQSDADGSVETETLSLAVSVQVVQARVVLCSTSTDIWPELHALQLCLSAQPQSQAGGERRNISSSPPQSAPTLNIPSFSQYQYPHGKEWCSPTALAMVLGYWHTQTGDDVLQPCATPESVPELIAPLVYDVNYGMGNWSFNTACAVGFGLEAYVTRLLSVQQIARWIAAGVPVICSLAWKSGELENAPIPSSNGHLVVVVGVQAEGWVAVADPAGHDPTQVQRWYRAEQFMACWQRHSAGTVYLIYPPGWKIPTPRSDDAWA
jgi:tetratricopeptide (TPR) repeat protein